MAGGQFTTLGVQVGFSLLQQLIIFLGTRRTGMTGAQKRDFVVNTVAPLLPVAAQAAVENSSNPTHKAEIAVLAQGFHDVLAATGQIQSTEVLEGTEPVVASPVPPSGEASTNPAA